MKPNKIMKLDWGALRFSIVGPLLAHGPADRQTLVKEIATLAQRQYRHPDGERYVRFGRSTIERWYYRALNAEDPVNALKRATRKDRGRSRVVTPLLTEELKSQYRIYPEWSYRLHYDNLRALSEESPGLGEIPSYTTLRRLMKRLGWTKKKVARGSAGKRKAQDRLEQREVRSYEVCYPHALWHLDFHVGRLRIIDSRGEWQSPHALCVLDDYSRLVCHIQWYLNETAECLIHGLSQAFYKRGLPRALMTDNGAAMTAEETTQGLNKLGIVHERTLPYSPYHNVALENMWRQTGRGR